MVMTSQVEVLMVKTVMGTFIAIHSSRGLCQLPRQVPNPQSSMDLLCLGHECKIFIADCMHLPAVLFVLPVQPLVAATAWPAIASPVSWPASQLAR